MLLAASNGSFAMRIIYYSARATHASYKQISSEYDYECAA